MARRKKPEDESPQQTFERRVREEIANAANRSEKTSWNRKMDNMVRLLAALKPIEEQILELQAKKTPVFDEIAGLRKQMVNECIHPFEYLIVHENHAVCKFCEKRVSFPKKAFA
jgi:hypothetical protein